eukprot:CAMPEP_0202448534 /NCGR_PEP_ID=MMETSP1360-20130828/7351_1 /ASSEMBLY_ACC=CAM_ASM_000848 /TAXON_ID=515479 /ORGANISM="Licmophora paradoxa, Strain CCMP2313" /LENGTH=212 /DNA_ID=CAMNT_0049066161 /DNA_START=192 /DNA_END=830 /DNA_ORIENTATION=+
MNSNQLTQDSIPQQKKEQPQPQPQQQTSLISSNIDESDNTETQGVISRQDTQIGFEEEEEENEEHQRQDIPPISPTPSLVSTNPLLNLRLIEHDPIFKRATPLYFIEKLIITIMNAAISIFGIGVGVGIVIGDTFREGGPTTLLVHAEGTTSSSPPPTPRLSTSGPPSCETIQQTTSVAAAAATTTTREVASRLIVHSSAQSRHHISTLPAQ